MRHQCPYRACCEHAPNRCLEYLGNPLSDIVGGCPLRPLDVDLEQLRGAVSLAPIPENVGALSEVPT